MPKQGAKMEQSEQPAVVNPVNLLIIYIPIFYIFVK